MSTYHEYDDMIHVWPLFSSFLPQGRQALEEIGAFVSLAGQPRRPDAEPSA